MWWLAAAQLGKSLLDKEEEKNQGVQPTLDLTPKPMQLDLPEPPKEDPNPYWQPERVAPAPIVQPTPVSLLGDEQDPYRRRPWV